MPSNIFVNACLLYPYCSVVTWPLTSIHDNGDDMECDRGGQYTFSANASQSCQGALHNNFPRLPPWLLLHAPEYKICATTWP